MMGLFPSFEMHFPLLLQFVILFFYINKHINLHIRINSMDHHQGDLEQQNYLTVQSLKLYLIAFIMIVMLSKIYFNPIYSVPIFFLFWIPQIAKNVVGNYQNCPSDMWFVVTKSLHVTYLPLYFMGTDDNILFLRPSIFCYWIGIFLISVQVIVIAGQRKRPRFFVPRALRLALVSGLYRYEHTFSSEAGLSDYDKDQEILKANLTPDLHMEFQNLDRASQRQMKREIKQSLLKTEECSICIMPLGLEEASETAKFFKTPCGHRFHKQCLVGWMNQKHQCPVCRKVLPQY